jgi:hypothetical protein
LWQGNRCCVLATIINCWHLKIIGKLSGTLAEMRMTSPLGVARALRLIYFSYGAVAVKKHGSTSVAGNATSDSIR